MPENSKSASTALIGFAVKIRCDDGESNHETTLQLEAGMTATHAMWLVDKALASVRETIVERVRA